MIMNNIDRGISILVLVMSAFSPSAWGGLASVTKSFSPNSISSGATSTLTITIQHNPPGNSDGIAFTDNYPGNLKNAATPNVINTCGGTVTVAAGGSSLSLSGVKLAGNQACSISVSVTSTVAGSYLNSTGLVTSDSGSIGPSTATLTVTAPPSAATPSGFNAFETSTAPNSAAGVIRTKIAASAFGLDVVALKSSGTAVETAFAGDVKLELVDASAGAGCGAYALIRNLGTLTFTAADLGRKTLAGISEPNAWPNARIRMSHPATGTPTVVACSSDNFAIRPASLSVAVSDTDWQNAGTSRTLTNMNASGGFVHKAGQPFTLRATARDASSNITSNYAGQPTLKTLACMLPTPTCTNGILTPGVWSGSGTVASTSATYSEAGSFNLTLEDQTFANVDNADSTLLERTIPQASALAVGRFVPDHFELTPGIVPSFKTFNETPANCPVRSFTYIGQPFGYAVKPTATILAKGQGNNTLANYEGSLWKIGGAIAPVVVKDCSTDPNTCVFTSNWSAAGASSEVIETYTYVLVPASTPNWDDTGSIPAAANVNTTTGLISFAASDTLAFKRSNTAPQAPFTAGITNNITVKDLSEAGNCGVANCDITTATPAQFANIGFDVTPGNEFRFGQLVLSNAHGSELLNLPVPIETRHWNGSDFTLNAADSCTQLSAADVALSNWQRYLNAPETAVALAGRFSGGRGNLRLSAPGEGNTGSVDLTVQLDAAAQTWLQGHWSGTPVQYDQNPSARASFGLHRGSKPLIYLREMW